MKVDGTEVDQDREIADTIDLPVRRPEMLVKESITGRGVTYRDGVANANLAIRLEDQIVENDIARAPTTAPCKGTLTAGNLDEDIMTTAPPIASAGSREETQNVTVIWNNGTRNSNVTNDVEIARTMRDRASGNRNVESDTGTVHARNDKNLVTADGRLATIRNDVLQGDILSERQEDLREMRPANVIQRAGRRVAHLSEMMYDKRAIVPSPVRLLIRDRR